MCRRNMLVFSFVVATLISGCGAIEAARKVAINAARKQVKQEIEQAVVDIVSDTVDPDELLNQKLGN